MILCWREARDAPLHPSCRSWVPLFTLYFTLFFIYIIEWNHKNDGPICTTTKSSSSSIRKLAASDAPRVLNVHVVPHSHLDAGWLKTVDGYYYPYRNNSIDHRGDVRSILSTAIAALTEHGARTFVYSEMKFFSMWWREQPDSVKETVRSLVANQQLTFVNGGWCMHDEAATHFMGMVDQTTLGHEFLLRELGVVPRTAWQLDPFGHSATQANLMTAAAGMDAIYFGRIDHQDLAVRKKTQQCEGLWTPGSSQQLATDNEGTNNRTVFWGLTGSYSGNYGPPHGFMFDALNPDDERLVGAKETRLLARIEEFLDKINLQSEKTRGSHIMLTMGGDFTYVDAHVDYANYDLLIGTIMDYQSFCKVNVAEIFGPSRRFDRVNIFYSNPDYYSRQKYLEMLRQRNSTKVASSNPDNSMNWSVKTDDFFPYSDGLHSFWTGYFTSRAGFKRLERVASSFLLSARQIDALPISSSYTGLTPTTSTTSDQNMHDGPLFALEDALGIAQHHDAISGTAKQHVADDYAKRLAAGISSAALHTIQKLKIVMLGDRPSGSDQEKTRLLANLTYCPLLNETICPLSEDATASNDTVLYVIVYNPLAAQRSSVVRLPVALEAIFRVERVDEVDHKRASIVRSVATDPLRSEDGAVSGKRYILAFDTGDLPPVGGRAFRIVKELGPDPPTITENRIRTTITNEYIELSNGLVSAVFDISTGIITGLESVIDSVSLEVEQIWGHYNSYDSNRDYHLATFGSTPVQGAATQQNSGAYIFRPSSANQRLVRLLPKRNASMLVNTSVGVEVHAVFQKPWIKQITRVTNGLPYIEVEYTIGPIPIDDGRGKEIVARLSTPIQTRGIFYTDSNAREFQKRMRDSRPTWNVTLLESVSGNYYPVNTAMYIEDSNASLALLVDRSQGGSSLYDGSIELMVQRRILTDDGRGVAEALNETVSGMSPYPPYGNNERQGDGVVYRGTHRIMVGKGYAGASLARSQMDSVFAEPLVFVGSCSAADHVVFERAFFSGIQNRLPPNVMLVTLKRLPARSNATFLLRLGHQYGLHEDPELSNQVSIDLTKLLADYNVSSVVEKTLTGNQETSKWQQRKLDWTGAASVDRYPVGSSNIVTLKPMEIRTFEVCSSFPA